MIENRRYLLIAGILLGAAYCALAISHEVVFKPDSPSYIHFFPNRTAGYPLYLNALGVTLAVKLQPVLYILALLMLWWEISTTLRGVVLSSALFLLCIFNLEVNRFQDIVMTESLQMTLFMLLMVFLLRFLRTPSPSPAALTSLFVGLACALRPSSYALIPALLLMVMFRWKVIQGQRVVLLAAALLPAILLAAVERIGTKVYHGAAATSLAGRHFYAKAGMIDAPPAVPSADPRKLALENALQSSFAPIRQILPTVPRWDVREAMSEDYEVCLEYACTLDLKNSFNLPPAAVNSLLMEVALARIEGAPEAYAGLVWERYLSLWTMYQSNHPGAFPVYKAFLQEHAPLPFQNYIDHFNEPPLPSQVAWFVRPAIIAIGGLTFVLGAFGLIGSFFRNFETRLAGAFWASLTLHASQFLTALVGVGIARYTLALWPLMMASLALAGGWALCLATKYARRHGQLPLEASPPRL